MLFFAIKKFNSSLFLRLITHNNLKLGLFKIFISQLNQLNIIHIIILRRQFHIFIPLHQQMTNPLTFLEWLNQKGASFYTLDLEN